jgi:hypothetical protein
LKPAGTGVMAGFFDWTSDPGLLTMSRSTGEFLMATVKKTTKPRSAKASAGASMITWTRLPKGIEIKAAGPKSSRLAKLLKDARLNPRDPCFGGDTCIV